MTRAMVIGAGGAIGSALVQVLSERASTTQCVGVVRAPQPEAPAWQVDVTDEASIRALAERAQSELGGLDLLINCVGRLHGDGLAPEKSLRRLEPERLMQSFAVNAVAPALLAKHFAPLLRSSPRPIFASLSARVGSIADNRLGGWYSYRASKAAQNMLLRTVALEWRLSMPRALCVLLHPGTVRSALSAPFTGEGRRVFEPEEAARALMAVLEGLGPEDSGGFFDWAGEAIPF